MSVGLANISVDQLSRSIRGIRSATKPGSTEPYFPSPSKPSMTVAGEPVRPQPSLPIVMRNALRLLRNSPSRKSSMLVMLCGPRKG